MNIGTTASQMLFEKVAQGLEPVLDLDLRSYIAQGWSSIQPDEFVDTWHIGALCEHLEAVSDGQIRNLIINMPPRFTKSLSVSVFWPTHRWTKKPSTKFLSVSYSKELSTEHSVASRRVITSSWYQSHWGNVFKLTGDQNMKTFFENDHSGYRISTSVGGTSTGRGGDVIIVDDPHNVKEAPSQSKRKMVIQWWTQVMSTRLNQAKTGSRVIVMQRCHQEDLSGYILDNDPELWEVLCLPNEYDPKRSVVTSIGWKDPRTDSGELLCPERMGEVEVKEAKGPTGVGRAGYASQYNQNPLSGEGSLFKRTWWRYYITPPTNNKGHLDFEEIIQSWDMSFKDVDTASYVVGQVWGRRKADKYLLYQIRERFSFTETIAAFKRVNMSWPYAGRKFVEDKANGTAVIDMLKHEIAGIISVDPQGGKIARAYAIQPQVESGNVYLPDPSQNPWVDDFIDEFSAATEDGGGQFWDQIDAGSQAILHLTKNKRSLTWGRHTTGKKSGGRRLTFGRSKRYAYRTH